MLKRLLWGLALTVWASSAQATTYYVATTGSDAAAGTIGAPWQHLYYALATAACGDLIYVRAGTYAALNTQTTPVRSCASFDLAVTIDTYQSEAVHLPSMAIYAERYLIIRNLIIDGPISGSAVDPLIVAPGYAVGAGAGYLRFINLDVHGNNTVPIPYAYGVPAVVSFSQGSVGHNEFIGGAIHDCYGIASGGVGGDSVCHGVYVLSDDNLIDGVNIHDVDAYGVHVYNGAAFGGVGLPDRNIVRNNYIHSTGKANQTVFCIGLVEGDSNQAYNNICNWTTNGVQTGSNSTNAKVWNNTLSRIGIAGSGAALATKGCGTQCYTAMVLQGTAPQIKNNIVWGNQSDVIGDFSSASSISNNLCSGANCAIYLNPVFLNAGGSYALALDFNIASTSPARDVGATIASVLVDALTTARPQNALYDLGAYEFIVGVGPVGTVCVPSTTFAVVGHTAAGSLDGYRVSTVGFDTTSACLLTLAVADDQAGTITLTDTYTNTWNARTAYTTAGSMRIRFYDCYPCLVGPAHVFTATFASAIAYPAIAVAATTGSTATPFDQINGATATNTTTRTTGAVVPTQAAEVAFAACSYDLNAGATFSGGGGYTLLDATTTMGTDYGIALAYQRQTTATSTNPACTIAVASDMAASIASYKFAAPSTTLYRLRRASQ